MKIDKQLLEKITEIIKEQWKLIGLGGLILILLIITFLVPFGGNKSPGNITLPQSTNPSTGKSTGPPKKSSNPLGFLFGDKKKDESSSQPAGQQLVIPPPVTTSPLTAKSTVTQIKPDGTKTTQTVTGGAIVQTTQGTANPNANISSGLTSNTEVDNIRIVFQNSDGTTTTYIPPGTPPDEVRWGRYTNTQAKYAINYPSNWQFVYSLTNGQEGVALYPPGENPNNPNAHYIGFGTTDEFLLPGAGSTDGSYSTPLIVDGQSGTLYTNGPLGNSYIASILQYSGIYFGLGGSKSDATFAYVYYYMINSLTFNIE